MKTFLVTATVLLGSLLRGQSSSTAGAGLNQNEVNVVRDGDFPESNSGVIRMLPNGKKGKVMQMLPDSSAPRPAAADSSLRSDDKKTSRTRPLKQNLKPKTKRR